MIVTALFSIFSGLFSQVEPISADFSFIVGWLEAVGPVIEEAISLFIALVGRTTASILVTYLGAVLILNAFYFSYQVVWFIIKKIPMLDIKP